MKFAEFIKQKRNKGGKTQKDLAKALGVSSSTVYCWENGITFPAGKLHLKIAQFYRMTQEEVTAYLNPSIIIGANELDEQVLARKERMVKIVIAGNNYKEPYDDICYAVQNMITKMSSVGWTIVSAQTALAMYPNEPGFFVRTVEWCTTLVFER